MSRKSSDEKHKEHPAEEPNPASGAAAEEGSDAGSVTTRTAVAEEHRTEVVITAFPEPEPELEAEPAAGETGVGRETPAATSGAEPSRERRAGRGKASRTEARPEAGRMIRRGVYTVAYYTAYGLVYGAELLAGLVPAGSAAATGAREGSRAARRDFECMRHPPGAGTGPEVPASG